MSDTDQKERAFALEAPPEAKHHRWLDVAHTSARTRTGSDLWATPPDVVASACRAARCRLPDLDIAALQQSAKAPRYVGPDHVSPAMRCGLTAVLPPPSDPVWGIDDPEGAVIWCNPPWSKVYPWLQRCVALVERGGWSTALCLIPMRPSTRAWQRFVWRHASEVMCADARLRFLVDGMRLGGSCPHDVATVVYSRGYGADLRWSLWPVSHDLAQTNLLEDDDDEV